VRDNLAGVQTVCVNVHQMNVTILQFREAQNIAEQVLRKDGTSGSDECDFWHDNSVFLSD
jgi:hypothetical protein